MLPSFKWWFRGSGESGGTGSTQNRDQQRRLQFQHRGLNNQVNLNNFIQIDKFKLVDYVKSARKMIPICRFSQNTQTNNVFIDVILDNFSSRSTASPAASASTTTTKRRSKRKF